VFVAAAARHRRAAFDAVDHAMDRLKTDAILWKRETRDERIDWIEARAEDHLDRARWEEQG
jgi:molybdopterin synthase catalytic subunit